MSTSCNIVNPDECGNMYFRSRWDFCTEYKVGDTVFHNNALWLCLKPHAGKDPKENNNSYWLCYGVGILPPPEPSGRIILDGGDAFTETDNSYGFEADGGSSSDRIYKPLI